MISVLQFTADDDFERRAAMALEILGLRDGFERGTVGRSTDDPSAWVLVTEWRDVGSYRRALGHYDVKLRVAPVLGEALDRPGAFESLIELEAGTTTVRSSDRTT